LNPKVSQEVQLQFIKHCSTSKKTLTWNSLFGKLKIATTTEECYQLFLQVVAMYRAYKLKDQRKPKQALAQQQKPGAKPGVKKSIPVPDPPALNTRMFERLYNLPPDSVAIIMKDIIAKNINIDADLETLIEKIKNELFLINILLDHIRFTEQFDKEYEKVLTLKDITDDRVLGRHVQTGLIELMARNYIQSANWRDKKYSYKQPQRDGNRNMFRAYKDIWDNEKSFPPAIKEWLLKMKKTRASLLQVGAPNDDAEIADTLDKAIITFDHVLQKDWTDHWDSTISKTTCHPMFADLGSFTGATALKELYGSAKIQPHNRAVAFHMHLPDDFTSEQFQQTLSVVTHLATECFSCMIWGSAEQLRFVWDACESQFPENHKIQHVIWLHAAEASGNTSQQFCNARKKYKKSLCFDVTHLCYLLHAINNTDILIAKISKIDLLLYCTTLLFIACNK